MRNIHKTLVVLLVFTTVVILLSFDRGETPHPERQRASTRDYNVWCIFTRVKQGHPTIKSKFERMLDSLLRTTGAVLSLNLVVDASSRYIAKDIVDAAKNNTGKYLKVVYHEVHVLTNKMESIIKVMQKHFSSQPGAYYSASLFFLSIGLHKFIFQSQVVMLDVDTFIKTDITELFDEFDKFSNESVIGAAPELTPVYHHILYLYRSRNNTTRFGAAHSKGGLPGINSGVLLLDLEKMRRSTLYQHVLEEHEVNRLASKYIFKGHLGDQDFYSLLTFEHPSLIHRLDCGWNRQLCEWWKDHGYQETFDTFARCDSTVKIYHGNCNSKIPQV
ncbi:xyloside xylosyltransferase 1 [Cimex lectularius]|uniref:Xyloside xylosyltransferase 1 n=1 Tax=Cimex lectularius TaxID=79782 RepID=A0A8I6RC25_CIMLE|nr:xyloside xylosyltransferase 1 [Cimex lectularius]